MNLDIIPYADAYSTSWDALCERSVNGTFLHTRKFLSYHGDRFEDVSALICAGNTLVGLMPAARALLDPEQVVSHPGATYGGIVHDGWLSGERMLQAMSALSLYYQQRGFTKLLYKALPYAYARTPSQDDVYALFRLHAQRVRCDLSSTVDLNNRRKPSERRKRGLRKATSVATVEAPFTLIASFWDVLSATLADRHGATPVHSLEELHTLYDRFPDQIQLRTAIINGRVEAGVVLFNSPMVWHAQYIAASPAGREACALDAIFEQIMIEAHQNGARYVDFGTSNEKNGWFLNEGLYRFKHEFGGGGMAYEHYLLQLTPE